MVGGHEYINAILSKSTDYQTTKNPLQSLRSRQSKLISSITTEEAIVHNYMPEEAVWSLGFDKDSNRIQREKFSVYLERKYLS